MCIFGAGGLALKAQILADKPTAQVPPQQPAGHSSSVNPHDNLTIAAAAAPVSTSGCPFLNAVNPPLIKVPWHQRFKQLFKPHEFQRMVLDDAIKAGDSMVALDRKPGFMDAYVVGTGDGVKTVFAGEAGTEAITAQSGLPFFCKCVQLCLTRTCIA